MAEMTPRERVLTALDCREPDRVPYCELGVDRALAQRLLGWGEPTSQAADLERNPYTVDEARAVAEHLGLNNLSFVLRAPVFAHKHAGRDGRLFYGDGMLRTRDDVEGIVLPDPHDDALYAEAKRFVAGKGDYALAFVTRLGVFGTMLSLGIERFSVAVYEERDLVEALLERYTAWTEVVAQRVCGMGFDLFVSTDDMAFKTAPFFSPALFRSLVLPAFRRAAERISLPWVVHSDGNIMPFLDDLVDLGIAGIHPCEKGAVDIREIKRRYGRRLCVLGNVDLNLLGMATPEEVDGEVRELIRDLGPGGGYIVTSGNSLAAYLKPENVRALAQAVRRYGAYPIAV